MEKDILKSWEINAKEWNSIIENNGITSRTHTNKAILNRIRSLAPQKVADLGCGEGWLTRSLSELGIEAYGFDATSALIKLALEKGNETYHVLKFDTIAKGIPLPGAPYEAAVFNFSIYQKEGLDQLLLQVLNNLTSTGVLLIQTLHPFYLQEHGFGYRSQWLSDAWKGLPGKFKDGHSWYARTLDDWTNLISKFPVSFDLDEIINEEEKPISLLLTLKKCNENV